MKKKTVAKRIITKPTEAVKVLNQFFKSGQEGAYEIHGSKAKTATAQEIAQWANSQGEPIDLGWLGRSLMAAAKEGQGISVISVPSSGRTVNVYRRSSRA